MTSIAKASFIEFVIKCNTLLR